MEYCSPNKFGDVDQFALYPELSKAEFLKPLRYFFYLCPFFLQSFLLFVTGARQQAGMCLTFTEVYLLLNCCTCRILVAGCFHQNHKSSALVSYHQHLSFSTCMSYHITCRKEVGLASQCHYVVSGILVP